MGEWRSSLCRGSTRVGWPSRGRALASSAVDLLHLECAGDEIGLIAYPTDFVAQASEAQRIDGAAINLQVVSASQHRFAGPDKLIRHGDAVESSVKRIGLAFNKTGQEPECLILISTRELRWSGAGFNNLFADCQEAIEAIAVNKLRVLVSSIRLE